MKDADIQIREKESTLLANELDIQRITAKDVMIKPVLIYSDYSAEKVLNKLKKEKIDACIVISKDKKFIGEITDTDIIELFLHQVKKEPLVKILNRGYRREFLYKTAGEMALKHKNYVMETTPINEVLKLIFKNGFEYLPVLNEKMQVRGVVTTSSIINVLREK